MKVSFDTLYSQEYGRTECSMEDDVDVVLWENAPAWGMILFEQTALPNSVAHRKVDHGR